MVYHVHLAMEKRYPHGYLMVPYHHQMFWLTFLLCFQTDLLSCCWLPWDLYFDTLYLKYPSHYFHALLKLLLVSFGFLSRSSSFELLRSLLSGSFELLLVSFGFLSRFSSFELPKPLHSGSFELLLVSFGFLSRLSSFELPKPLHSVSSLLEIPFSFVHSVDVNLSELGFGLLLIFCISCFLTFPLLVDEACSGSATIFIATESKETLYFSKTTFSELRPCDDATLDPTKSPKFFFNDP
ncbi:hypothetical protein Avbf_10938 [Armadillidium vulgare]|nr:hypothetical protein Avbf_10938 [Armadillidium vulgare]